jgi:hypothetical protein
LIEFSDDCSRHNGRAADPYLSVGLRLHFFKDESVKSLTHVGDLFMTLFETLRLRPQPNGELELIGLLTQLQDLHEGYRVDILNLVHC